MTETSPIRTAEDAARYIRERDIPYVKVGVFDMVPRFPVKAAHVERSTRLAWR